MEVPRRPVEGGWGYPRFHAVIDDAETGIPHEWQIGTRATSELYEQEGIRIPEGLQLKPGMKADLHDIEYDIFKGVQEKYPDVAKEVGIPAFRQKVDLASAQAGKLGDQFADLPRALKELHEEAGRILQRLMDNKGNEWIQQFYH
jgi:hypothetical protein